ncbi:lytic transglycosylase domain-containing protein [Mesorhizobium sp. CAU 1732]|uniref:lytic transglycosylase domain-containing protein n=1 Tax=Mesorhizobium sp. CAU 1732 TaxID=3140358 RepID=UPI003261612A
MTMGLLGAVALGGCTTAEMASIEASSQLSFPADPELPETVAEVPTVIARAEPAVAETEAVAVASAEPQAAPAVAEQSFAGPTPTSAAAANPVSDVLVAKKVAARSPELDALIAQYASLHGIPEDLMRRVVKRESTFNPAARNGPYWGLMQIRHDTAQGMGYRGPASGLLDAETNLKYAGKYLRGAYLTAAGDPDQAVRFYSRGYYYDAKRKGLLEETGLRPARKRMTAPESTVASASEQQPVPTPTFAPAPPVAASAASGLGFSE